jgi:hypothetical protein
MKGHYLIKCLVARINLMRIVLISVFILLGANLMIEMLDSNMTQIIRERNETIQRSIDNMGV